MEGMVKNCQSHTQWVCDVMLMNSEVSDMMKINYKFLKNKIGTL